MKKNVIKKYLLSRKIKEYFSKHPSAKSVVVKSDVGNAKTLWRVVKEGNSFSVVEVNTIKEEFTLESEVPPFVKEAASLEYSNLSKQFVQAMTPPFDHARLSNVLRVANQAVGKVVDPKEKNEIGAMIGALTNMVDATTAGGGSKVQMQKSATASKLQTSSKKVAGKVIREDDEDSKKKDKEEEDKPATKKKPEEPVKATDKLEPKADTEEEPDLETNVDAEEPQAEPPVKNPSSEEMVVGKSLSGQTIKAANIVLTPNGGELTLDLVSAAVPAKLQWSKDGKAVFHFNGRPYVLKRE